MRRAALRGLLAMLCGVSAQAAPPSGAASDVAPPPAGVMGGAAAGTTATPPVAPAPEPPTASPPPASSALPRDGESFELSEELEAARRRRERRRLLWLDEEAEREQEQRSRRRRIRRELAPAPDEATSKPWRLVAPHFMVGVERVTNLLSWTVTRKIYLSNQNGVGPASIMESEQSGNDVSLLGSGAPSSNVFGVPRLAFDGMFSSGLTLGGSISYLSVSGKSETSTISSGAVVYDSPTISVFVLAPRAGLVLPVSRLVGVWLRAGISRISRASDAKLVQANAPAPVRVSSTTTLVNLTFDPQLIITPVPHVGITLGPLLDIGISGSDESSTSTSSGDVKASSYGVTSGLVAIF